MSESKLTLMDDLPPIDQQGPPQQPPSGPRPPPQQQQQVVYQDHAAYSPPHASQAPQAPPAPAEQSMYQTVLDMATSTVFLKTVLVAAAIVLAVMLFPVEDYVLKYATFAQKMPHAALVIKALAAGLGVTLIRPPQI
jgi:hypothetical protein